MTMTDPIADMLTRLRNANSAYHDSVSMPSSSVKVRIAAILQTEGYIASHRVEDAENGVGKNLILELKFGANRERSIAGLRRVSQGFAFTQSQQLCQKYLVDLALQSFQLHLDCLLISKPISRA